MQHAPSHDSCSNYGQASSSTKHAHNSYLPYHQTPWLPDTESGQLPPEDFTNPDSPATLLRVGSYFSSATIYTIEEGVYPYTEDLLALSTTSETAEQHSYTTHVPSSINTPLNHQEWVRAMAGHPDHQLKVYLLTGIRHGFRIGVNPRQPLISATRNMPSAYTNPQPVTDYLKTELRENRIAGPLDSTHSGKIHVSRFGVIPKRHQPGKWRLILDLSHPPGYSVNDGIAKELATLQYASVDDAARIISHLGKDAKLAKIDIAHAYRNIPVHPRDWHLLGMEWEGRTYIDKALPFGLRSAPKIFSAVSDTFEWILSQNGVSACLHYLDDFLTMGERQSDECKQNLEAILSWCRTLGIPVADHKVEGPTSELVFLGIEFSTSDMIMRLPDEKLQRLKHTIGDWLNRKAAKKREILSIIGELVHAAKVVSAGRIFIRRMINTAHSRQNLDHWIRLNNEFHSDLYWWHMFLERWNGVSMLSTHVTRSPDSTVFTDASGAWGCGATDGKHWFQCPWDEDWHHVNITVKELVPIILALGVWGKMWHNQTVLFRSDNQAVVDIIRAKTSKESMVMHLLRCMHFLCAAQDIRVAATHIAGVDNGPADALSRNKCDLFFVFCPKAHPQATHVPQELWDLVVAMRPDWLSESWRSKLSVFSGRV